MRYIFVLIVLYFCSPAFAQYTIAVEGGLNVAALNYADVEVQHNRPAKYYYVGIVPWYRFHKNMAISADIHYSVKGNIMNRRRLPDFENKYAYLDFAPHLIYRLHQIHDIGLGFYLSKKLSNEDTLKANGALSNGNIKSTDFGLAMSFRILAKRFYVKFSYKHGLRDIANINIYDTAGVAKEAKVQNRLLQLGLGYNFSL